MGKIIGLKELREDINKYVARIKNGESLIVMRRSDPLFKITPVDEGEWEEVVDFTKIYKGGVDINDLLTRL
jgi:antitoxin (DNA-binding transcriptional repressor) of toxin-antitoxin stability system